MGIPNILGSLVNIIRECFRVLPFNLQFIVIRCEKLLFPCLKVAPLTAERRHPVLLVAPLTAERHRPVLLVAPLAAESTHDGVDHLVHVGRCNAVFVKQDKHIPVAVTASIATGTGAKQNSLSLARSSFSKYILYAIGHTSPIGFSDWSCHNKYVFKMKFRVQWYKKVCELGEEIWYFVRFALTLWLIL